MSAINFVVRDGAGDLRRGAVDGGAQDSIIVGQGEDISLNLRRGQILSYERNGMALEVMLINGRVIVIEGFFGADGSIQNDLFVSADGLLAEVDLTGDGQGGLLAQYVDGDAFGKWSPDDALYFIRGEDIMLADAAVVADDEAGMLATALLGGIGGIGPALGVGGAIIGGATVLDGLGGGDDGLDLEITAGTKGTGDLVNAEDYETGAEISGTGTPGTTVEVVVGDVTETATVTEEGTWTVVFEEGDLLPGEYEAPVTVTLTDEDGKTKTVSDVLEVDTVAGLEFDASTVETDGTVNLVEAEDGFELTGTTEAGSTVMVEIGGVAYEAEVTGESWSLVMPAGSFETGTYDMDITVTATDPNGNTATVTDTLEIDTETSVTVGSDAGGEDGIVNAAEHEAGLTLSGSAEAGATVVVTMGGVSKTVTATEDGMWSAEFASSEVETGTYEAEVEVVSTDLAGNTAMASTTVSIDTDMALTVDTETVEGGLVNAAEAADGITITGTAEPGASVTVEMNGYSHTTTALENGEWSVDFAASEVPQGTLDAEVQVTATDAAGNTQTAGGTVAIDTEAAIAFSSTQVEVDGIINKDEAADGVTFTGTTEPGSVVVVSFGLYELSAEVDANGNWQIDMPAGSVTPGELTETVTATATDAHGNTASTTMEVEIDTMTLVGLDTSTLEGDGVVNAVEKSDGVVIEGMGEAGAAITVTMNGIDKTTTVAEDGSWSVLYASGEVPGGETEIPVSVVSVDPAGNMVEASDTVTIDTYVNSLDVTSQTGGADGVVNHAESGEPITVSGIVEAGSAVSVTLGGQTMDAAVDGNGNWTVTYPAGTLEGGEYSTDMVIKATDAAGNTSEMTETVIVDTVVGDLTLSEEPIELDDVINLTEKSDGVVVSGTATPGLTVTVSLGTATHQVVAAEDGTWSTTYLPGEVPGGTYMADIKASIEDAAGNYKEVTDSVKVDTEVVPMTISDPIGGDNVINAAESADGVALGGTVEANSKVVVEFDNQTQTVWADGAGNWSAEFTGATLANSEYLSTIKATATDPAGNVKEITDTVKVDTWVNQLDLDEGDQTISAADAEDGLTFTGQVEPGSVVMVTFEDTTRAATVAQDGSWTVSFLAGEVPDGEYTATVSVEATDAAGNTKTISDDITVDTVAPDAPVIESFRKGGTGVREIGTSLTEDEVTVQELSDDGSVSDIGYTTEVDTEWGEMIFDFNAPIPDGSHLLVTATDDAGNASTTMFVQEETDTNTVDVSGAGLAGVNVDAIDLQFAEESELTLSAEDLAGLSENGNSLVIHGGSDDTVTLLGGAKTGAPTVIDNKSYDIYSLGEDGTVYVDSDITVHTSSII